LIAIAALALIAVTSLVLFTYGANLLYLSWMAARLPAPVPLAPVCGSEPMVLVQLPVYNERYVAERLIDAVCCLDWPRAVLRVQVLDDSDDETVAIVARRVAHWRQSGIHIDHVRRLCRAGYKAGALAHGLALSDAPLVAIFDADFVPQPDFLRRTIGAFADPRVGFAQARWGHLNESYSWLTRVQSLTIDFHFLVEQPVRAARQFLTNFTGTAGIWRRSAIEDAGGWSARTLTEDLDLSYRAQLRGWRARYIEAVVVEQELPVGIGAYRRQQARWATGSFQCAFLLLGRILGGALPARVKWQALVHLCSYSVPVLVLLQLACYPLLLSPGRPSGPLALNALPLLLNGMGLAPLVAFAVAQHRRGRGWWHGLAGLGCQVVGAGLSLTIAIAFIRSFWPAGEFERTPKYRIERAGQPWGAGAYGRRPDLFAFVELGLAAAALSLALTAFISGQLMMGVYSVVVGGGFLYLAATGLAQSFWIRRPGPARLGEIV